MGRVCDRVAEAQALLQDHLESGRSTLHEIVKNLPRSWLRTVCCEQCGKSGTFRRAPRRQLQSPGINSSFPQPFPQPTCVLGVRPNPGHLGRGEGLLIRLILQAPLMEKPETPP